MSDFDTAWLDELNEIDRDIESSFLPLGKFRVRLVSVAAETRVYANIAHRFLVVTCQDQDNGKMYKRTYQVTDKAGAMARTRLTIMGEQWLKAGLKLFSKMVSSQDEVAACPVVWLVSSERQGQPKAVPPGEKPGEPQMIKDEKFERCDDQKGWEVTDGKTPF